MPKECTDNVIVSIYKEKGDIQDGENYKGTKLMSHTMKNWERVINRRRREELSIMDKQFCLFLCQVEGLRM